MVSASSVVKPDVLASYVRRHGNSVITAGMDTRQIWHNYLRSVGGNKGKVSELENLWVTSLGGTGKTLSDKYQSYLSSQGYTGDLRNMMRQFFKNS